MLAPLAAPPREPDPSLRDDLAKLLPELRAQAIRLSGDVATADDIVQDAIVRALRFADQYERGTNLRAWAHQIVFSVFVTRWRRVRRERRALENLARDPCAWTVPDSFAPPDVGGLLPSTLRQLDALPEPFRAVVFLVDIGSLSYRDAAQRLRIPVGTVMSRLHRGRKFLAAHVGTDARAA